jgi:hypothetical protein
MLTSTITAPPFMCSTMVSVTTTGQRSTPVIAPMATSQRLNAFSNDLIVCGVKMLVQIVL